MNTRCLSLATALFLTLTIPSLALSAEVVETKPLPSVTEAAPAAADAPVSPCSTCTHHRTWARPNGSCAARFWDWLTYQPLCQRNKCCKISAMPCCAPRNYWFFPCTDGYGSCSTGGYTAKSCGCR